MSGFAAEAAGPAALNEPTPEQRAKVTQLCCCLLLEDMFILVHLKLCAGPEVRRRRPPGDRRCITLCGWD